MRRMPLCARAAAMALALLLACPTALVGVMPAHAATDDIEAKISEAQQQIEESAAAYDTAVARIAELEEQATANEARIAELEEELPAQQERSDEAIAVLYKMNREGHSLLNMVLASESITDFITRVDYLARYQNRNLDAIRTLTAMEQELQDTRESLDAALAEAQEQQKQAETSLAAAQEAREKAQREAQEQARREREAQEAARKAAEEAAAREAAEKKVAEEKAAEEKAQQEAQEQARREREAQEAARKAAEEAAAREAAEKKAAEEKAAEEKAQAEGAEESEKQEEVSGEQTAEKEEPPATSPSDDGADWSSDKSAFVGEWAPRIDSYLSGSPLAGTGETFASAAWDYGVDPRWSPAISTVESSKGAACFKSHNAWGWGSSSWDSWEAAIEAHVAGLARGYGYTLSESAAKKYCPPNWQHWYSRCAEEMNSI